MCALHFQTQSVQKQKMCIDNTHTHNEQKCAYTCTCMHIHTKVVSLDQSQLIPSGRSDSRKSVLWQRVWFVEGGECGCGGMRENLSHPPSKHSPLTHTPSEPQRMDSLCIISPLNSFLYARYTHTCACVPHIHTYPLTHTLSHIPSHTHTLTHARTHARTHTQRKQRWQAASDKLTEKSIFFLSWLTALGSGMASVCFITLRLSPVRMDWSILSVVEWILHTRMSAGILSPTETSHGGCEDVRGEEVRV